MSQVTLFIGLALWAAFVGYIQYLLAKNKLVKSATCFLLVAIFASAFFGAKFLYLFQNFF
jgi:hypothetical protein